MPHILEELARRAKKASCHPETPVFRPTNHDTTVRISLDKCDRGVATVTDVDGKNARRWDIPRTVAESLSKLVEENKKITGFDITISVHGEGLFRRYYFTIDKTLS